MQTKISSAQAIGFGFGTTNTVRRMKSRSSKESQSRLNWYCMPGSDRDHHVITTGARGGVVSRSLHQGDIPIECRAGLAPADIDLAIGSLSAVPEDVEVKPLFQERFVMIARK